MTFSRYKRLVMVVTLPLLIFGGLLANILNPYSDQVEIVCDRTWCEAFDNYRDAYNYSDRLMAGSGSRFANAIGYDIHEAEKLNLGEYRITAPYSTIGDALITGFRPYDDSDPTADAMMLSWVGASPFVNLGQDVRSFVPPDRKGFLDCRSLTLLDEEGVYEADCSYGDGDGQNDPAEVIGRQMIEKVLDREVEQDPNDRFNSLYSDLVGGHFRFIVPPESRSGVNELRASVNSEILQHETKAWLYIIFVYPILLYVFLILSGIIWIFRRAKMFIDAG